MNDIVFHPTQRYLTKLYLGAIVSFPVMFVTIFAIGASSPDFSDQVAAAAGIVAALLISGIWYLIASAYYRTIRYEIHQDEIVVNLGLVTKTVKHVPFRTITNIQITRDPIDRILSIGTLSIQTAGSGMAIPEERLVGLQNVQNVYERVARQLRQFRQGMGPTQTDLDVLSEQNEGQQVFLAILQELRAMRTTLEAQS